jgi:protoporphyrinogen oxidase
VTNTLIIGAGPAGLTAAYELARLDVSAVVYEQDRTVGGLSRTVDFKGFRFDIGGHRFFSKVPEVRQIWQELLGDEFLTRSRQSRIYYNDTFFDYPLKFANALVGLGPVEATRVLVSYCSAQLFPSRPEESFEHWVSNRFGSRLFEIFFKSYTEKVWGMPCSQISADWAAQRIKNLNLVQALKNSLLSGRNGKVVTTLIDSFHYPRLGPGMMWEQCRRHVEESGIPTVFGARITRLQRDGSRVRSALVHCEDGAEEEVAVENFVSTMPLAETIRAISPPAPPEVLAAADRLRHRDFLTVVLIVNRAEVFPDNWIYIHSPRVKVGRVQNYKNWSPDLVPDPTLTSLGLEYFVHEDDELWSAADETLVELGVREMSALHLIKPDEVTDGTVVRMRKAYPVYDRDYRKDLAVIRSYIDGLGNLQVIGRNGQHRYNNQDHSMLTGVYAARNIAGAGDYDVWDVNVEDEYHEEASSKVASSKDRSVPDSVSVPSLEGVLRDAFARYDPVALGTACGVISGIGLFLATVILLLRGGDPPGPTLSLLGNYLIGFEVDWPGALLALPEAGTLGFVIGYTMAGLINRCVGWYESSTRRQLEVAATVDPLDSSEPR